MVRALFFSRTHITLKTAPSTIFITFSSFSSIVKEMRNSFYSRFKLHPFLQTTVPPLIFLPYENNLRKLMRKSFFRGGIFFAPIFILKQQIRSLLILIMGLLT